MMITLEELPIRYREFLGSYMTTLKVLRLADRYSIPKKDLSDLSTLVARAFLKEYKLTDLPQVIQKELGVKGARSFLLAADMTSQYFMQFTQYFGKLDDLIDQWRIWGRQLGARKPAKYGSSLTEKLIHEQGVNRAGGILKSASPEGKERTKPTRPATQAKPGPAVGPGSPPTKVRRPVTVSLNPQNQQQDNPSALRTSAVPKVGPEAPSVGVAPQTKKQPQSSKIERTDFLRRIMSLNIDKLRPSGESAAGRLDQVKSQLYGVVRSQPRDRMDIAKALKQSQLFALYQVQARESLQNNQTLDQVIYQRYQSKRPYLLKEEFEAVANIVKTLQ